MRKKAFYFSVILLVVALLLAIQPPMWFYYVVLGIAVFRGLGELFAYILKKPMQKWYDEISID